MYGKNVLVIGIDRFVKYEPMINQHSHNVYKIDEGDLFLVFSKHML